MSNLMLNSFEPQLARFYCSAQRKTFGAKTRVSRRNFARFQTFEKGLLNDDIDLRHYSFTISEMLKGWVKKNGVMCVPQNTFTGNWALERYKALISSTDVSWALDEEELLHTELLVARLYIYKNAIERCPTKLSDVVDGMRDLLDSGWTEIYDGDAVGRIELKKRAMAIINEEQGTNCKNYFEVITCKASYG